MIVGLLVLGLLWADLVLAGPFTHLDVRISDAVTPLGDSAATGLAQRLADAGSWSVTGAAGLLAALALAAVRRTAVPLLVMSGGLVLLAALGFGLKALIGRPGPRDTVGDIAWGGAFPSGHAAAALVVAALLALLLTETGGTGKAVLVWITAGTWWHLMGWSRVHLDVHWAGDVLAGWALGLVVVGIVSIAWSQLRERKALR